MFVALLDRVAVSTDAELDEQLRANELAIRELRAEQAALVAAIDAKGSYRADGHRTVTAYLRATVNTSSADARQRRLVATVCAEVPELGQMLLDGRIGVAQIIEIGRIHTNPRARPFFTGTATIYATVAEHASHHELKCKVDEFLVLADQDGAYEEVEDNVEQRTAGVHADADGLHVRINGGDPLTAEEFNKTFEWFVQREFERDVAEAGDDGSLPRNDGQRRYDAFIAMSRSAREHGDGAGPADVVVNVVADPHTLNEALADADIVVNDSDEQHTVTLDDDAVDDVIDAAADDPEGFVDRRCETSSGIVIHPKQLLQAALTGYVRRVIVDSQGVVVDWGRRRRFFTGPAREAAKLLTLACDHPGCLVGTQYADVDHLDEWVRDNGPTDQRNSRIKCRTHNRFKSRARWRTRRDGSGRVFHIRPDGTIVLPVGAREPDLTDDDLIKAARARAAALRPDAA